MQDKLPIISLLDVRVHYATEGGEVKKALDGVSLNLKAGEWLSIVGANGSGKSTLAGLLLGFIPLSAGERNVPANLTIRGVLQRTSMHRCWEIRLKKNFILLYRIYIYRAKRKLDVDKKRYILWDFTTRWIW